MSAYESLAASYDSLTWDVDYEGMLRFLRRLWQARGAQPESVLDLACGTGSLSMLLARQGLQVIGTDLSEDMLMEASEKACDLPQDLRPLFVRQSMQELELPYEVDAAVCCLDSLNYVTDPADCREIFRRVYDTLAAGGTFLFDINTPKKLRGLDGQVFLDETEDTYCVWRAAWEPEERLCVYGMDLFRRQGDLWQRSVEEHLEYAYEPEDLKQWLQEAGFTDIRLFGDRTAEPPTPEEERVWFSAGKD